jgi:hypothetical protein
MRLKAQIRTGTEKWGPAEDALCYWGDVPAGSQSLCGSQGALTAVLSGTCIFLCLQQEDGMLGESLSRWSLDSYESKSLGGCI